MRVLAAFPGKKISFGWWKTRFLGSVGERFLAFAFPRSAFAAGVTAASEAAKAFHDHRIGKGGVFHLFRLPRNFERRICALLLSPEADRFGLLVASKDAALDALAGLISKGGSQAAHQELRGHIDDAIRRVTAAGERERVERSERAGRARARIEQVLRERRERLSAPPAPASTWSRSGANPAITKVPRRRRKMVKVDFKTGAPPAAIPRQRVIQRGKRRRRIGISFPSEQTSGPRRHCSSGPNSISRARKQLR